MEWKERYIYNVIWNVFARKLVSCFQHKSWWHSFRKLELLRDIKQAAKDTEHTDVGASACIANLTYDVTTCRARYKLFEGATYNFRWSFLCNFQIYSK